jgi:signal transduction histidine kinase
MMCVAGVFAQTRGSTTIIQTSAQADSLRRVLAATSADALRVATLNALAFYFGHTVSQYDSALHYAQSAQHQAESIGFRQGVAEAHNTIANVYRNQGKYNEALQQCQHSLRISEELHDQRGVAVALNTIGNTYRNQGKQTVALEYFFRALPLAEQAKDQYTIATTLYYISMAHRGLNKLNEALQYCFSALRIRQQLNDKRGIAAALHNVSVIYRVQQRYDEALQSSKQSLTVSQEIGDNDGIASSLHSTTEIYSDMGNKAQTLHFGYQALSAKERLGHKEGVAGLLGTFAAVYYSLGAYDSARIYALRAIALADTIGVRSRKAHALEVLSKCYESLGQPTLALQYYRQYVTLRDSLVNLENLNMVSALKEHYEAEKRQQQITLLNTEKDLQMVELGRQTTVQQTLLGVLVIVVIVALMFGWLYQQKHLANVKIVQQQNILKEQSHHIEAVNTELTVINAELKKSNAELDEANRFKTEILSIAAHDLKNPLMAIMGFTEIVAAELPADHQLQTLLQHTKTTAYSMGKLIHDLLDSAAVELGNIQISHQYVPLGKLVNAMIERYGVAAETKEQVFVVDIAEEIVIEGDSERLEQVFDNLISNAVKYSALGGTITVRMCLCGGMARAEIQDDGPGLSQVDQEKLFGFFQRLSAAPTGGESSNGVGLAIVKKIVDLHGGRIWCQSSKDEGIAGATFIVELPVEAQAPLHERG